MSEGQWQVITIFLLGALFIASLAIIGGGFLIGRLQAEVKFLHSRPRWQEKRAELEELKEHFPEFYGEEVGNLDELAELMSNDQDDAKEEKETK